MKAAIRSLLRGAAAVAAVSLLLLPACDAAAQDVPSSTEPPASKEIFPLKEVKTGMHATAWTVFRGTRPEPMEVEILGVLRNARGPGNDLILAQLHGTKPEYSGVAAGMSGSPVYIGSRLVGAIAYRIGEFSKDPIAGITPIEQMLEVRDLPLETARAQAGNDGDIAAELNPFAAGQDDQEEPGDSDGAAPGSDGGFLPIETPLVMSGFGADAIRLWKKKTAGTGMEQVAAGGAGGSGSRDGGKISSEEIEKIVPGMAVSAQIVRGDFEIAATCTVTYVDPKQLLACGHPILQAGRISLPMTAAEVVTTLPSASNSFKIVNTGATLGAFSQDRYSAVRGVFGATARMIPLHMTLLSGTKTRELRVEVLDQAMLTPQAMMVSVYQALLTNNQGASDVSYHVTGTVEIEGSAALPIDVWASSGELFPASVTASLMAAERFQRLYNSSSRRGAVRQVDLRIESFPRRLQVELSQARLIASSSVRAGQQVEVEATLRRWRQPEQNVRLSFLVPTRMTPGNVRLLISDAGTLDRALEQLRPSGHSADFDSALAQARKTRPADQLYVSLLMPEAMAAVSGQTLANLPLSMANALESLRSTQDVNLNGESAEVLAQAPAGGLLNGFQILYLHIDTGGGIN